MTVNSKQKAAQKVRKILNVMVKPLQLFHTAKGRLSTLAVTAVFVVAGAHMAYATSTSDLQNQINALNAQNNQTQSTVSNLQTQAASYQDAINKLQDQINGIESAIAASQTKQNDLAVQIKKNQDDIAAKKASLGADIKAMYVDGTPSTIEMLATSNNLSDYVDKQEYRNKVQDNIQVKLKEIAVLQAQLQAQKIQVDQLLQQQQAQQAQLDSDRSQQAQLLGLNEAQQDAYNAQISANKGQIASLERQQAAINAANSRTLNVQASGGSGGACDNGHGNGGYPMVWCNAPQDTIPTISYSSDPINRECTSFAYWYFTSQEGQSLHVTGNAKDWAFTANRAVDRTPQTGAIAISTAGPFGHAMIVLATPGQSYGGFTAPAGYVITMSMNYDYYGHFIVDERAAGSLYYIH